MNDEFHVVSRPHGDRWVHKQQDFWVVFYPFLMECGKPAFFAYRSLAPTKGRDPWSVANKKVGEFKTLDEAMSAQLLTNC